MAERVREPPESVEEDPPMSLLKEAMTPCTLVVESIVPDEYGGYTTGWTDDTGFDAAIVFDTSMEARKAESAGVNNRYTVTTERDLVLKFHDGFRRESDSKIFRVTSDGDDKYTPVSAGLDMRQVTAEEWRLPGE